MIFEKHSALIVILGGVAFFMYGMRLMSESLEKLMANRLREILSKISGSNLMSVGVGIALTVCLQSSGAVTSLLVGLGSAGVVALSQVMGMILGTAIGTTLTVQIISFNIAQFGLPIFAIALTFYFVTKKRILQLLLSMIMGFGLIFFGLEMIGWATTEIQRLPYITEVFVYLSKYPYVALLCSILFTGFVHSSAVTIGFAMSLALGGLISTTDAIYWVFGANIGTTSTALMTSLGGNYVGRQVAWAHFFYKVVSVFLFLLFVEPFAELVIGLPGNSARDIANAHTIYNIVAAALFFPMIGVGAKGIAKLFPPNRDEQEFKPIFLQEKTYESSTLAIAYARREIMRMSDIVNSMIRDSILLFKQADPELEEDIAKRDNQVDVLHHEIKLFLVKHTSRQGVSREIFDLISIANDLESVGDVIDNNLLDLAKKKQALKLEFSDVGWKEIQKFHKSVAKISAMAATAFQMENPKLALEVIDYKRKIRKEEKKLRESHIDRLNQGLTESINTSSIHLDVLGDYRRIVGLMSNNAYRLRKLERQTKLF